MTDPERTYGRFGYEKAPKPEPPPEPVAGDQTAMGHHDLPILYIGVVSLAVRLYNRLPTESKIDFEDDGDPMARVAGDFNQTARTLRMVRNGKHDWTITEKKVEDA